MTFTVNAFYKAVVKKKMDSLFLHGSSKKFPRMTAVIFFLITQFSSSQKEDIL